MVRKDYRCCQYFSSLISIKHNIRLKVYPSNVVFTLIICFFGLAVTKKLVLSSTEKQMVPKDGWLGILTHVSEKSFVENSCFLRSRCWFNWNFSCFNMNRSLFACKTNESCICEDFIFWSHLVDAPYFDWKKRYWDSGSKWKRISFLYHICCPFTSFTNSIFSNGL